MAIFVFDASALVKRYALEAGTPWVRSVLDDPTNDIYIARVTGAEVVAALRKKARLSDPKDRIIEADAAALIAVFKTDFANDYILVEVTAAIVDNAIGLIERHQLRGYDAIQLAVASAVAAIAASTPEGPYSVTFVSSDADLLAAARHEGLVVDDPQFHP